ncbi:MAG TPA: hypothetical protein PK855_06180, partial [Bacteroidales bacterium]|nr:hypothetical protein [Bacteroidales bacterium]
MKKLHILFIITILLFTGCAKDLDLSPQDTITDDAFWKTAAEFKLAANNLYPCLDGLGFNDTESDIAFNVNNVVS